MKLNPCLNIRIRGLGNPGIKEDGFKEQIGAAKEEVLSKIFLGTFREYFLKDLSQIWLRQSSGNPSREAKIPGIPVIPT